MITLVFWLMTAGMLLAGVWAGVQRIWLLALVIVALSWDNFVVAIGATIGAGDMLRAMSVPRYVAHAVLTPLLIPIVFGITDLRRRPWVWVLTAALIAIGVYTEIFKLNMELREYAGTLRYANAGAGPPLPAIITNIVLLIVGAMHWRKEGVPWLCLGSIAMFGAAGSGVFWLGNAGELVLMGGILMTAAVRSARTAGAKPALAG